MCFMGLRSSGAMVGVVWNRLRNARLQCWEGLCKEFRKCRRKLLWADLRHLKGRASLSTANVVFAIQLRKVVRREMSMA